MRETQVASEKLALKRILFNNATTTTSIAITITFIILKLSISRPFFFQRPPHKLCPSRRTLILVDSTNFKIGTTNTISFSVQGGRTFFLTYNFSVKVFSPFSLLKARLLQKQVMNPSPVSLQIWHLITDCKLKLLPKCVFLMSTIPKPNRDDASGKYLSLEAARGYEKRNSSLSLSLPLLYRLEK